MRNPVKYYPEQSSSDSMELTNPAFYIFGKRFLSAQKMHECLIEFLLVFAAAKISKQEAGEKEDRLELRFHRQTPKFYYIKPRIALKRFVFWEQASKARSSPADKQAYTRLLDICLEHIHNDSSELSSRQFLEQLQDLLRGYAAVLQKRSWCAQCLLPMCQEMVLCELMPNEKERVKAKSLPEADAAFNSDRHNFLTRIGEVYYLHILQAFELMAKADELAGGCDSCSGETPEELRDKLEGLLRHLLTAQAGQLQQVASWVEKMGRLQLKYDLENIPDEAMRQRYKEKISERQMPFGYIAASGYYHCGRHTIDELISFLSAQLHPVRRVELLAHGVVLQVLRMLTERTNDYLEQDNPSWIIEVPGVASSNVKKLAIDSLRQVFDNFSTAINRGVEELALVEAGIDPVSARKRGHEASTDVFRARGKEIELIIPARGPGERFSLCEDLVRFLVLALIPPQGSLTLDEFLRQLYEHFHMVIGPKEYLLGCQSDRERELSSGFELNRKEFQDYLKAIGFLKDLSDSTSIVMNPYAQVSLKGDQLS